MSNQKSDNIGLSVSVSGFRQLKLWVLRNIRFDNQTGFGKFRHYFSAIYFAGLSRKSSISALKASPIKAIFGFLLFSSW